MATRPAMPPLTIPRALGFPLNQLAKSHVKAPAAADVLVTSRAEAAKPFAAKADPALNPNQPNQSRPAPIMAMGMLWGSMT